MEFDSGTVLLGKYRVDEVLGTGGMGRVVRASHLYLQQSFAIKILLAHMAENAETVSRFLREAQATVRLKSEHIARVVDVGTMSTGVPFMVMEYLEGNDLNQILRHHGPQSAQIVCDLMLQACEGMAEAHAMGIVHRDIKPSNFFITRRPDGTMLLKILDFGISKTPVGVTELTGTQTVIGTPTYMAPEQMKSGRHADARSDVWSMGIVMYQLLSGRPPFSGESYAELVLKVGTDLPMPLMVPLPAGLADVIMRCLEKDPNLRQQNVGELARMLAPYASDPISASQSAARATRILQNRASSQGVQGLPVAAGGGLATPIPLSPAQLTPRSWPPSSTSVSQGSGQQMVTYRTRSGRGLIIAGACVLVVLAGAGGFFASQMVKGDAPSRPTDDGEHVEAPPPRTTPVPEEAAKVEPAKANPVKTDAPKADAAKVDTPKSDASKTDTSKVTAAKTDAAKTDAAKTDAAKTSMSTSDMLKATASKTDAAKTDTSKAAVPKTDPSKTATTKTDASKTDASKTATTKTDTPKATVSKTDAAKTDAAKPTAKTDPTKTVTKTDKPVAKPIDKPIVKPKPKKDDDLFNSRH